MRCRKCQTEIMDGEAICHECGDKIEVAVSEGVTERAEASGTEKMTTAHELDIQEQGEKEKGRFKKLALIGGAAAAVLLMSGMFALGGRGEEYGIVKEIMYVKDGGIYGVSLSGTDKKPVEYAQEKIAAEVSGYKITKDNWIIYKKAGDLFAGPLGKKAEELASDIGSYLVSEDGKSVVWEENKGQ